MKPVTTTRWLDIVSFSVCSSTTRNAGTGPAGSTTYLEPEDG